MCCKHRRPEVRRFQHDPNAFTQGLLWSNGSLFESTGLYGESTLRELQLGSNGSFAASSLFCCVLVSLTLTCRLACVLLCFEFALMSRLLDGNGLWAAQPKQDCKRCALFPKACHLQHVIVFSWQMDDETFFKRRCRAAPELPCHMW